jgi:hypothetical protein
VNQRDERDVSLASLLWEGQPNGEPGVKVRTPKAGNLCPMKTELVGIYRQEQDATSAPAFEITRAEARELKKLNQGYFINHGNDMRLMEFVENAAQTQQVVGEILENFRSSSESRKIPQGTVERALGFDKKHEQRKKLFPYLSERILMRSSSKRMKPLAVVAVESWA